MASNPYINKVVYGNETLLDLTADTAVANKVLSGYTFHDATGAQVEGSCDYDVNSQDANALVAEVLNGKTFYARGSKMTGTMPNRGAVVEDIDDIDDVISIQQGYHDGSGTVSLNTSEKAKLIAENIKKDVVILGVTGTYEGSATPTSQAKTVTPTASQQTVLPDSGVDYLSQVTVNAIPYVETDNAAGGKTATIG